IIVLLAVVCAACVTYWPYLTSSAPEEQSDRERALAATAPREHEPETVPANRGQDVPDGFRGDVHPLLRGHTKLEVKARWTPVGKGRDKLDEHLPELYSLFQKAKPARSAIIYTEREFSAFLPEKIESAGQVWAMDLDKVAAVLRQFHPNVTMHPR